MEPADTAKRPIWFMIYAVLAILWGLAGVYACYSQLTMGPDQLAQLPPIEAGALTAMPAAIRGAYVVATVAGLVGGLLLALGRRWARWAFIVSLLGVVVQFGWTFGPYQGLAKLGALAALFPAFIAGVCISEIWFSDIAQKRGWLT
jgi:hypothetical protein